MRPLIIPNSFLLKENPKNNNNKYIKKSNIYNNYLSNKISSSEINSILIYNNSISNSNTTCNTYTNSNNKSNSFHKNILCNKEFAKINSNNIIDFKIEDKNKKKKLERGSKLSLNTINNDEVKSENYIKSAVEYIDDILINLLKEERDLKLKIDPLYFQFQNDINSKMRAILIDWLIDVHLKFNFRQETLYITINIIDRYLSLKRIERCNFQLLGVTALFIACKQNEISFRKLKEYVFITDNAYSEEDIKIMENKVLNTLNFDLLFPSSLTFYEILSYKLNLYEDKKKFNFGEFLMESFYLDENCLKYSASTIACAVGYIVMKYFKMENYKECYNSNKFNIKPIKEFIDKFSKSNNYPIYIIKECAKDICYFMNNLSKGNLKSTIRKYSIAKYENVTNLLFGNVER
jgi:cyclin B